MPSRDVLVENIPDLNTWFPFGPSPEVGDALYLGFDQALAGPGTEISFYLWTGTREQDRETRRRLIEEWENETAIDGEKCARPWWLHYSVRTRWEYFGTGGGWKALEAVVDETRALTLSGPIRFSAPADQGSDSDGNFFIRCRMMEGRFECPPEVDAIALNAVEVRHDVALPEEKPSNGGEDGGIGPSGPDGLSNGRAGQRFILHFTPVVADSTKLRVALLGSPDEIWQEASTWDLVGPHDRTFVFSPEDGALTFGDGKSGRVPSATAEIFCSYHLGGGPAGNIAEATLSSVELPGLAVTQPFAAVGGAAAESVIDAQARALDELGATRRAVTLADYETLALATPGVPIAKARAISEYHPAFPCFRAAGCVTVVAVPRCPDARPEPGEDFLYAVAHYLERRRTLATEVHVIGPTYMTVIVSARLNPVLGVDFTTLQKQAIAALQAFFNPLRGGPNGTGWPVGRDVYRSEVMALLAALPGVKFVDQFGLQTDGDREPRCGNLSVCPSDLVASGAHLIEIAERKSMS